MKNIKKLFVLVLAVISGILYRLGGAKGFNTKIRDLGCSLVALIALWILVGFQLSYWWAYLLSFGLLFGALTTYWDSLFGFDNFWFHGFMIGVSYFPIAIVTSSWLMFSIRCLVLAVLIGLLNLVVNKIKSLKHKDVIEEFGRGFLIVLSLLCFIIK